ncbi:hypothetical protein RvY_18367 [Ramazzottius varieornatus]|uniref:Uncharacterized protein n=1 Tax=Ramazzottius varieornatus TaxID=947166 RepID=A0A1D1W5H8_RAMVA|nr:hypothetical protein RvY_18367 [Ramazzottius varieornatus]
MALVIELGESVLAANVTTLTASTFLRRSSKGETWPEAIE